MGVVIPCASPRLTEYFENILSFLLQPTDTFGSLYYYVPFYTQAPF